MTPHRTAGWVVAALGFTFIAIMTLTPHPGASAFAPSWCILCGEQAVQDTILNVILFVPFGIGLHMAGVRRYSVIAISLCFSAAIELLQMHIIAGRDSSLGDVITNTIGGALGVALASTWRMWIVPTATEARCALFGGAIVWVAILGASVWALHRSLPNTTLWGQWDPAILHFDRFTGTIVKANAAGFDFPPGALGSDPGFRRRLVSDSVLVNATVIPAAPPTRTAPILSVYDPEKRQVFLLAQRDRSLMFSIRMNAARAMIRDPIIGLDDVFPAADERKANDTVRASGGVVDGALVIRASDDTHGVRERRIALGPALGWTFFLPWAYAFGAETAFLSALWLGGLFLPLAYWAGRTQRPLEVSIVLGLTLVLGLFVVPVALHGAFVGWIEWLGIAIGGATGIALSRRRLT